MAAQDSVDVAPGVHCVTLGKGTLGSNVYLVRSDTSCVLVDAAWRGGGPAIARVAESVFGKGARPEVILLTHIHPDHSGSAGELARSWEVPVYVHPDEVPMAAGKYLSQYSMPLDRWVVAPLMRLLPGRMRARAVAQGDIRDVTRPLAAGGDVQGLPDWRWIAAPGHTPGSVAYWRPRDGVLISGDAVLTVDLNSVSGLLLGRQRLAAPPRYTTWDWDGAQRSIAALADLAPRVLAPGHGRPLVDGTADALRSLACAAAHATAAGRPSASSYGRSRPPDQARTGHRHRCTRGCGRRGSGARTPEAQRS